MRAFIEQTLVHKKKEKFSTYFRIHFLPYYFESLTVVCSKFEIIHICSEIIF